MVNQKLYLFFNQEARLKISYLHQSSAYQHIKQYDLTAVMTMNTNNMKLRPQNN